MLERVIDLKNGTLIETEVKIMKLNNITSKKNGKTFKIGDMVDRKGHCRFFAPSKVNIKPGACYKIVGRVYNNSLTLESAEEIETIPDNELALIPTQAYILETNKVLINNYCKTCKHKVEEVKKRTSVSFKCPECNKELSPDEVEVKIFLTGKMHSGTETLSFFIPHKVLEKKYPNLIQILDDEGEDALIELLKNNLNGKSFIIDGFKKNKDENEFIIMGWDEV